MNDDFEKTILKAQSGDKSALEEIIKKEQKVQNQQKNVEYLI